MALLLNLATQNLFFVFNQRDAKKRRVALQALWAPDGVLATADGTHMGHNDIDNAAGSVLQSYPEYDFSMTEPPDVIQNVARMHWSFGAVDASPAITGLDFIVASRDRIVAIYRFSNGVDL